MTAKMMQQVNEAIEIAVLGESTDNPQILKVVLAEVVNKLHDLETTLTEKFISEHSGNA